MTAANDQPVEAKKPSLLRSSLVMASGTLVSRLLGFIRAALLVLVLSASASGGVAEAFNVANTLPNTVYNLLAAGVFDAVLIPQIVRALKSRSGSVYLNRLLTLAGTILFAITAVTMIAAPMLVSIMGKAMTGQTRTLAIVFALWCLPQIFFYGLYNLFGEVLNAQGIFGPYMWAPVVNNVVSIAGLGLFLGIWGPAGDVFKAEDFTSPQLWLVAGTATLGVILQALILIIPVAKSGVKLRLDFHFKGTDFGSASKVAGWTFATLLVSQLGVISTSNLAIAAGNWAENNNQMAAGLTSYTMAFMVYMVPQSLISVTLATVIFTRLANNAADGDYQGVAANYHMGVKLITMLSMWAAAILMAASVPIMQIIFFNTSTEVASLYANVLVALVLGIPSTGIVLISQRVFFAFENAKPVFFMGIVPTILQLVVGWSIFFLASPQWWTVGASLGETVCRVTQGFIAIFWTAHLVRTINAGKIIASYLSYLFAFIVSAASGWVVLHFISPMSVSDSKLIQWFTAFGKLIVVALVVSIVFFLLLRMIDQSGTAMLGQMIRSRILARFKKPSKATVAAHDEQARELSEGIGALNPDDDLLSAETVTSQLSSEFKSVQPSDDVKSVDALGLSADVVGAADSNSWTLTPPAWEDILVGEDSSRSLERAVGGPHYLDTGQIPIITQLQRIKSTNPELVDASDDFAKPLQAHVEPKADSRYYLKQSYNAGRKQNMGTANGAPRSSRPVATSSQKKFDPTIPALILGVIIVIVGIVYSISTLRSTPEVTLGSPTSMSSEQSEDTQSVESPVEEVPAPVVPAIASVSVFSWNDDSKDHPELASALTDGDSESIWYSRYYFNNEFQESTMISLLVELQEEAVVSEITLDVIGSGGQVTIRAAEDGNPRAGTVLATSSLDGQTVIKLAQPTKLSQLGLNFVTLPTDDEGLMRAKVSSISVN